VIIIIVVFAYVCDVVQAELKDNVGGRTHYICLYCFVCELWLVICLLVLLNLTSVVGDV